MIAHFKSGIPGGVCLLLVLATCPHESIAQHMRETPENLLFCAPKRPQFSKLTYGSACLSKNDSLLIKNTGDRLWWMSQKGEKGLPLLTQCLRLFAWREEALESTVA